MTRTYIDIHFPLFLVYYAFLLLVFVCVVTHIRVFIHLMKVCAFNQPTSRRRVSFCPGFLIKMLTCIPATLFNQAWHNANGPPEPPPNHHFHPNKAALLDIAIQMHPFHRAFDVLKALTYPTHKSKDFLHLSIHEPLLRTILNYPDSPLGRETEKTSNFTVPIGRLFLVDCILGAKGNQAFCVRWGEVAYIWFASHV